MTESKTTGRAITGRESRERDKAVCEIISCAVEMISAIDSRKRIIVALSGGPDSVALLDVMTRACQCMTRQGLSTSRIIAAHCNFHLRGDESDRDERHVRQICRQSGVTLLTRDFDTLAYCREHNLSIEAGARRLRHDWFATLCESEDALLATGHNADDNVETMLLNMLRGSGVKGLRGMLPADRHIIRPLLGFTRSEILRYLDYHKLTYVTDSTNLETNYRRNYLRHEIIPRLRERWAGADKALARTLECLRRDEAIVNQAIKQRLAASADTPRHLDLHSLCAFASPSLLLLRKFRPYGMTPAIADEIGNSCEILRPGAYWQLHDDEGNNYRLVATSDGLHLIDDTDNSNDNCDNNPDAKYVWQLVRGESTQIEREVRGLSQSECALPHGAEAYEWRQAEPGMRIRPLGMKGSKLVADTIRDSRITPEERSKLRVLCRKSDGEVIWIPGIKRSRIDLIADGATEYYLLSNA